MSQSQIEFNLADKNHHIRIINQIIDLIEKGLTSIKDLSQQDIQNSLAMIFAYKSIIKILQNECFVFMHHRHLGYKVDKRTIDIIFNKTKNLTDEDFPFPEGMTVEQRYAIKFCRAVVPDILNKISTLRWQYERKLNSFNRKHSEPFKIALMIDLTFILLFILIASICLSLSMAPSAGTLAILGVLTLITSSYLAFAALQYRRLAIFAASFKTLDDELIKVDSGKFIDKEPTLFLFSLNSLASSYEPHIPYEYEEPTKGAFNETKILFYDTQANFFKSEVATQMFSPDIKEEFRIN
ncbi:MAG: hypothetical protein P1U74_05015 [Legionellaceae bacterium]|nr:hypothetical protein [Legionellaceae bacterium]